jgi:hypothetical protein
MCALVLALLPAKAEVHALLCDGTADIHAAGGGKEITKFRLIVDLDKRLITGFAIPVDIIDINANLVSFRKTVGWRSVSGKIDRLAGALHALDTLRNAKTNTVLMSQDLDLMCKPTF